MLGIVVLCQYLKVFFHTIQEDHFGSEFLKLGLEFGQHNFALRTFGIHTLLYRSYWKLHMTFPHTSCVMNPTFVFSLLLNQLLVEISRFL